MQTPPDIMFYGAYMYLRFNNGQREMHFYLEEKNKGFVILGNFDNDF